MADQHFGNHRKFFPLFHFVVAPLLLINFVYMAYHAYRNPVRPEIWAAVVAFALVALALSSRLMALKVQDRVIRLEERLRLRELATGDLKNRIHELTPAQLVGLRFASDAEVCELASAALRDNVSKADDIKKQVKNWRADHHRA